MPVGAQHGGSGVGDSRCVGQRGRVELAAAQGAGEGGRARKEDLRAGMGRRLAVDLDNSREDHLLAARDPSAELLLD